MRSGIVLITLGLVLAAHPALAQFDRGGGPAGDFRVEDRPITAPSIGSPDVMGSPPNPMRFGSVLGGKPPDDVLKGLDNDLGRSTIEPPGTILRDRPLGPVLRPGEDLGRRPAALSLF